MRIRKDDDEDETRRAEGIKHGGDEMCEDLDEDEIRRMRDEMRRETKLNPLHYQC